MEIRKTKPGKGNKFYITKSKGGWSLCIQGKPTDSECNVLANCVGYACGRFNEIIKEMKYPELNCNAENFIERAKKLGLAISNIPHRGGIMVWQKGTLSSQDGAGHVAIVEDILEKDSKNNPTKIYLSESGYNSKAFWNSTRTNSNGNWGQSSAYKFRGCIINPSVPDDPEPEPPTYKYNIGDKVVITGNLYVSSDAQKPAGMVSNKVTNITRIEKGAKHPYNTTGDLGWMDEKDISEYIPQTLKVGDTVKITGTGNGNSYGTSNTAYGIGWTRQILKIYIGRPYPYQVGNSSGTTGFYKSSSLQKIG